MINIIEYNYISAVGDEAAISVDDTGIQTYTLAEGKKGVSFQNLGPDIVWFGGSTTVSSTNNRGNKLFPNQTLVYKQVKNTFTIGFRCATGKTASIGVVNHD